MKKMTDAKKRLIKKYGADLKQQGIGFFRDAIQNIGAAHDHESKDAGNFLYYIALESCTSQCADLYGHAALWESHELMTESRHKEN